MKMDMAEQFQKLQALRDQGVLTEEEFVLAKKRVLDGTPAQEAPRGQSQTGNALNDFRLSTTDKWIGGICGGLAVQSGVPAWSWRILFVLTALLHGIGVLVYILLWIFVPVQSVKVERAASVAEEVK
jgi:phage shock protein PspC (stress-responsive transcriptional regulator)